MDINIMDFIAKESLILLPILLMFGYILKKSPIKDWLIPYILYALGVVLGFIFLGQGTNGILQGFLVATASIGVHQGIKQGIKK
jgi:hypothetical protein